MRFTPGLEAKIVLACPEAHALIARRVTVDSTRAGLSEALPVNLNAIGSPLLSAANPQVEATKAPLPLTHLGNPEWQLIISSLQTIDLRPGQTEEKRIELMMKVRTALQLTTPADCKRHGMVGRSLREALFSKRNRQEVWHTLRAKFPTIKPGELPEWFINKIEVS